MTDKLATAGRGLYTFLGEVGTTLISAERMSATTDQGIVGPATTADQKVILLYDEHRPSVSRFLLSKGCSPQDAEEVVQETFLRLYEHLVEGRREDNLRGWIFQVAHNLACNLRKSSGRVVPITAEAWEHLYNSVAATGAGPEEQILHKERLTRVQASLARLTQLQRDCLSLRMEGFRYREIGSMLNVATSTVSSSLRNALQMLLKGAS